MHRELLPLVASAAFGCVALPAQTQLSLPLHADAVDGHHSHWLPFGLPHFRTQILVDASAIAANGAMLNGISFRADRPASPFAAAQVANVTVELSQTSIAVGALTTAFASNVTGSPTNVFQGTVSLPATGASLVAGPQPWNVVITFPTPFLFTTASGNLLIDIVGNNPVATAPPNYSLDAVQGGGSSSTFGTSGFNPTGDNLGLGALSNAVSFERDARRFAPGSSIDFVSYLTFTTPPGVVALGTAPQPVPIDLGPIGAPTNLLYVAPILLAPHNWTQHWLGWHSWFSLSVPNNPQLIGVTLYGQSTILEPAANALGMVFSGAVEVRIGDSLEQLPLQQVDVLDPAGPFGTLLDFGSVSAPDYGAVPIRLEGVFF